VFTQMNRLRPPTLRLETPVERRRFLTGGAALAAVTRRTLALTGPPTAAAAPSPVLPSKAAITSALRRVRRPLDRRARQSGNNQWANATFFSGLTALYRLTSDARYLNYARSWARTEQLRPQRRHHHAQRRQPVRGQAYLDLYEIEPDPAKLTAIETCLQPHGLHRPGQQERRLVVGGALHMAMPPFARLGVAARRHPYYEKLHSLYRSTKSVQGGPGSTTRPAACGNRDRNFLPGNIVSPSGKPVLWVPRQRLGRRRPRQSPQGPPVDPGRHRRIP